MEKNIESSSGSRGTWKMAFNDDNPGVMNFSLDGRPMAEFNGVELGVMKESRGIGLFTRLHAEEKTDWRWAETNVLLPFGPEPNIWRKWEQAGNHVRVTTEISINSDISPGFISVDSVRLPGKWKKATLICYETQDGLALNKREIDLSPDSEKDYNFNCIPLSIVFISHDGLAIEIGAGFDLWRWACSAKHEGASSEFSIKISKDSICLKRVPLIFQAEHVIPKTGLKFTWYFAWNNSAASKSDEIIQENESFNILTAGSGKLYSDKKTANHVYVLNTELWPDAALVKGGSGKAPCFCSRQTENLLKYWIRFIQSGNLDGVDVLFLDMEPHLCLSSSHLERGDKKVILHWDYPYFLAFWEWANRALSAGNGRLRISLKENSIFKGLPSSDGL